ncbi:3'(2'),5'-bisphosphate nucleotidase [hydrothermal vent metagenome]|uniref:3'(2'),5'-bisphosphate nucleotidase n=1 Tax=hydrothermal vent metagenome TaxID=652676 RepID=A0A3B1BTA3_9ZZZZ
MTSRFSNKQETEALLAGVKQIAYEAGRVIMEVYERGFSVEEKPDHTPVTEADLAAHQVILNGLNALTPDIPILSEECQPPSYAERARWPCYWLVDPLDGTREFIRRNGEFSVNIALIEGQHPVVGTIYGPVVGRLYYAAKGMGAFKKSGIDDVRLIHVRETCPEKVVIAGSRSHYGEEFKQFISHLPDYEIIPMGSALKSCLVAEGKTDIYARLGPTSEWDTAAAQIIVEEAGGLITDTRMQPLRYNTREELLNPHFFVFGDKSRVWSEYL